MASLAAAAHTALLVLKLARPRTWCFIVTMFVFGYVASGRIEALTLLVGIVVFSVMTAVSNLFNAWTDQVEDRINLPHRQRWLDQVGPTVARLSILACYAALVTLPWLVSPLFALIVAIGALISIFYSWGPTLKAHPLLSLFSFATGVTVPFLAGWLINRDLASVSPVLLVVAYFFFAYGTLKNLPDVEGDRAAGVTTIFTLFSGALAGRIAALLLMSPYVLLLGFIASGVLEPRYLLAMAFAPVVALIVMKTARAQTRAEREATHALGYFYQLSFFLVFLLLYWTTPLTLAYAAIVVVIAIAADSFKIDSRPYDLRWNALFRIGT